MSRSRSKLLHFIHDLSMHEPLTSSAKLLRKCYPITKSSSLGAQSPLEISLLIVKPASHPDAPKPSSPSPSPQSPLATPPNPLHSPPSPSLVQPSPSPPPIVPS